MRRIRIRNPSGAGFSRKKSVCELGTGGSSNASGVVLTVKLSQEYVMEEPWITLDPDRFQFTEAQSVDALASARWTDFYFREVLGASPDYSIERDLQWLQ